MTTILLVQLLVSFLVGGALITIISLIAERTNERISGIIMTFPTTLVLGFFFLGFTTNAENVANVIPATMIPLGIASSSSVIYILCSIFYSNRVKKKIPQILLTLATSTLIWFVLAPPFAIYKFSNLPIGIAGFFIIIAIAHFIFRSKNYDVTLTKPKYTASQIAFRAVFTGCVIAMVVLLGKKLNPFLGGIFTMFPAATFATMILLHFYYEPRQLFYFMKNAPLGSISLFIYTISVMLLFPLVGIWFGTLAAYCFSLIFSLLLIKYQLTKVKRKNSDQDLYENKLP